MVINRTILDQSSRRHHLKWDKIVIFQFVKAKVYFCNYFSVLDSVESYQKENHRLSSKQEQIRLCPNVFNIVFCFARLLESSAEVSRLVASNSFPLLFVLSRLPKGNSLPVGHSTMAVSLVSASSVRVNWEEFVLQRLDCMSTAVFVPLEFSGAIA